MEVQFLVIELSERACSLGFFFCVISSSHLYNYDWIDWIGVVLLFIIEAGLRS